MVCELFFLFFVFLPQEILLEAPFLHSWDFYCIFHYSIHFNTWIVTHPSVNHGLSCWTSVIWCFQLDIAVAVAVAELFQIVVILSQRAKIFNKYALAI